MERIIGTAIGSAVALVIVVVMVKEVLIPLIFS